MSTDPRARENPDPYERNRPVPRLVLLLVTAIVVWAVGYIFLNQGDDAPALGDQRTMSTLEGKPAGAGAAADGLQLYTANCLACHQATGAGLPGVFPPLGGSEWVLGSDKLAINILLHGVSGKLTVKDVAYSGQMPAFKDKLNDAEIAAVLSYIRANFGNSAGKIAADVVQAERAAGKDRKDPWNGDEELAPLKQ